MAHDGIGNLTFDVAIEDEGIPILVTVRPRRVVSEAILTGIASRTANISQAMIGRTDTRLAKAILVQEECQRIHRINAVLDPEIVERLSGSSRWGAIR